MLPRENKWESGNCNPSQHSWLNAPDVHMLPSKTSESSGSSELYSRACPSPPAKKRALLLISERNYLPKSNPPAPSNLPSNPAWGRRLQRPSNPPSKGLQLSQPCPYLCIQHATWKGELHGRSEYWLTDPMFSHSLSLTKCFEPIFTESNSPHMMSKEMLVFASNAFKFISYVRKLSHGSFTHNSSPCEIHLLTARMHKKIKGFA